MDENKYMTKQVCSVFVK